MKNYGIMIKHHGNYGKIKSGMNLFKDIYKGRTVLITGHTGFKGSWLALWLKKLDAKVIGFALKPPTKPSHFELLGLNIISVIGDIRDHNTVNKVFSKYKPEIVFHLAAQPIVRYSYANPVETFETNVMGTLNVFESCRKVPVKAIVNITSDKVYENKEWHWGYRESDTIGGYDPYSCSKGCSELITSSYRSSFFNEALLASARAGNVIGGGDWAIDRLIPDIMKAVSKNRHVVIRNPYSTRPWQHVLDSLSGYLLLGQKLLERKKEYAEAWNFGNSNNDSWTVEEVVKQAKSQWNSVRYKIQHDRNSPHESGSLKLDCSKAYNMLNWMPVWTTEQSIQKTISWYKEFYQNTNVLSFNNLNEYIHDAGLKKSIWTR